MFKNAVGSIRIGVQDYRSPDDHRHISAVRNYYAGILLLAKEVLARRFPNEDPDNLIAANLKPVATPNGTVEYVPASRTTIDFATVGKRFSDLGIAFDHKLLNQLNQIRNDIEHKYSSLSRTAIIEAIAKGFPAAAQLFRLIGEDPVTLLGDEWQEMLATTEVFEAEFAACRATLKPVQWHSYAVSQAKLACSECGSNLVQQADAQNADQDGVELDCRACGAALEAADVIEHVVESEFSYEAYKRYKDAFEDGPIFTCPECDRETYIDVEEACANCGHAPDTDGSCAICGERFPLAELLADPDMKLCSYHQHVMAKDD